MKKLIVVAIVALLVLSSGLKAVPENRDKPAEENVQIAITAPMSRTPIPISVSPGGRFSITLSSNQTTGYSWRLRSKSMLTIISKLSNVYNAPEQSGMVGRGGTETWTFKAAIRGKMAFMMEYARPWESDTAPAKVQAFAITVE